MITPAELTTLRREYGLTQAEAASLVYGGSGMWIEFENGKALKGGKRKLGNYKARTELFQLKLKEVISDE